MASNGYPHMVFVQPDAGLDKESLAVFLEGLFPDADVTDKPLRVDMALGGYLFSFWLEEAEGVADRYATYLPEGARRRWLSRCESMIDLHGQPDPERVHAATAQRIVAALQEQDGIEVFSEETRRFLGMDYGDGTPSAPPPATIPGTIPAWGPASPAPGSDAVPAPEEIPAAEFAPHSIEPAATATPADDAQAPEPWTPEPWTPPAPVEAPMAAEPEPHVVEPAPHAADPERPAPEPGPDEPTTVWMPAAPDPDRVVQAPPVDVPEAVSPEPVQSPAASTSAPAEPATPYPPAVPSMPPVSPVPPVPGATAGDQPAEAAPWQGAGQAPSTGAEEPEKKGFFKRVFGRRPE
ncbi:MAG: hypothetical protein IPK37_02335 [Austwickia sp.]|nr:MAG: hypothetical protein IPK37_02335 [Austwickia sp.]